MIPLGLEVELFLELPDGASPLALRALPLRVDGDPQGASPFRLGLHFIHPGGAHVLRIRSLIYEG